MNLDVNTAPVPTGRRSIGARLGLVLGCREGRSTDTWVDFDFFGHQIVAHLDPGKVTGAATTNPVDGHDVPVPHFGAVLGMPAWEALAEKLKIAGVEFVIEPKIRFAGETDRPHAGFLQILGAAKERCQLRVNPLEGRRLCLQQVQHLPVPAGQARVPEQRVEALVDQPVDQLQPESDRAPIRWRRRRWSFPTRSWSSPRPSTP